MADTLYTPQEPALCTLFGDIENFARAQGRVLPGTPGTVLERSNAAKYRFYAHQYYDANGKKLEKYVAGPVGDVAADEQANQLRTKIAAVKDTLRNIRLLGREGFQLVDSKTH